MEEDNQQKLLKQQYLRQEILNKNYDPQEFVNFLNNKLNIHSDINKCTFSELKNVVKQFLNEKLQEFEQSQQICIKIPSNDYNQIKDKPKQIIFNQFFPPIIDQEYFQQIKCIKIVQKYSKRSLLKCQRPQRKYTGGVLGIGATSFLEFKVWTHGLNWCVGRRYSDFQWLRNSLIKFFPSQIIPPIPNKKASKRSPRHLQKRMKILTLFLNDLIHIPQIFNNRYVQGFLNIQDSSKFQSLKKQADNKRAFESISSTQTETGKLKLQLSLSNVSYYQNLKDFVNQVQLLYKQITRNSKCLQNLLINQVNTLYQMGNQFSCLHQSASKFADKFKQNTNITKLHQIYITLNNMMIQWGTNLKNQYALLENNFNIFFKYVREQFMGFHQIFQRESELMEEWAKAKSTLERKKQKIFLLYDTSKWEIPSKQIPFLSKSCVHQRNEAFKLMLPRQSVIVEDLKKNMSFYLSRIYDNCQKNIKRTVEKFCQNFKQFTIKNKVNNQQIGQLWMEMAKNFSNPESKKRKLITMPKIETGLDKQQQDN